MLYIKVAEGYDLAKLTTIFVRHKLNAELNVGNGEIVVRGGAVSEEFSKELCEQVKLVSIANYAADEAICPPGDECKPKPKEAADHKVITTANPQVDCSNTESTVAMPAVVTPQANASAPAVACPQAVQSYTGEIHRGDIFWTNFGDAPNGYGVYKIRPSVIVSNPRGLNGANVLVVPMSSSASSLKHAYYPTHLEFSWDRASYSRDGSNSCRFPQKTGVFMADKICTIEKTNLISRIGHISAEILQKLEGCMMSALGINVLTTGIDEPVLSLLQIELLEKINISKLRQISSDSTASLDEKAKKILSLYGLDLNKAGVPYLLEACTVKVSPDKKALPEILAAVAEKHKGVDKNEMQRLIIARLKETLGMKYSPANQFVRLVRYIIHA